VIITGKSMAHHDQATSDRRQAGRPLQALLTEPAATTQQDGKAHRLRVRFQHATPPLLRASQSGSEPASSCSVNDQILACLPHLRAFARSLASDRDRADDLVQSTIQRALGIAGQLTPGTNFKGWIFTILRNLYFGKLCSNRHDIPIDEANLDSHATQPMQLARPEFNEFRRFFNALSAEQREALVLVDAAGFTYAAAAAMCGSPIGTIKSRVSRARSELGRLLNVEAEAGWGLQPSNLDDKA
jgi:RNA polymerase sigma-70 factor (ECF subfamily)